MNLTKLGAIAAPVLFASLSFAGFDSATTVFGPGGDAGLAVPGADILGAISGVATFGETNSGTGAFAGTANAGETLFFQIGGFYVGGAGGATSNPLSPDGFANTGGTIANNRAYGVIGSGRSDINFVPGLFDEITVQVRGSETGMVTGSNPATSFGGVPTNLADADGSILIWTELGLEAVLDVSNTGYSTFSINASDLLGDSIVRLSLVNDGPADSVVALGELTLTVPAPGAASLAGLGLTLAMRRRR